MKNIIAYLFLTLLVNVVLAQSAVDNNGNVQLPLETYNSLINTSRNPKDIAPATYAIGQSTVKVNIDNSNDRSTAIVTVNTSIETFEDKWTLIPILTYGAAINTAMINGKAIQLVQDREWLSWSSNKSGIFQLQLSYTVDAHSSQMGYVLALPIPPAAATALTVDFPDTQLDIAVLPASNLRFNKQNNNTVVTADIATTSSLLISWHLPSQQKFVISRANYQGKLAGGAVTFSTQYDVELFTNETINVPLIPTGVTLNDVKIDNQSATVFKSQETDEPDWFVVSLQGRGKHTVTVIFETQLIPQQGPSTVKFPIPQVPISQFSLHLSGKKEVSVLANNTNKAHVRNIINNNQTIATVYLPMTQSVSFSWVDAVPKDLRTKLRANANIYHAISAEEGVLYGQALIDYEITHGETNSLSFNLPSTAQVNRINSSTGGISDWSVNEKETTKTVTVFLDRAIKSNYQLQVYYEQLLQQQDDKNLQPINVPLLKANNMHRQRGIVALLAGSELALKPIEEIDVTRVGENQLPAFFRNQITLTIAHTFKYTSQLPKLIVNTVAPERKQGKYNAQVDTLISLGEVTMRASASIQMDIKSGAIVDLQLQLPEGINVLNITGPSIRNHKIVNENESQMIDIEFTQEMTGQFRIEVNYEQILTEHKSAVNQAKSNRSELLVASLQVSGTEVQHGRIAVEALTAVEVQTAETRQLSSLEINELPQQLLLKTTNPILLAYKYVNTESPHLLRLSMTRHQELAVQLAAIESARYQTLITNDGLSVTTATFNVRNSRRQFLRLNLPEGSEVWSVFVDGKAEKPAQANGGIASSILIKMLNSVSGFPVTVVYATAIDKMGIIGNISSQLPLPDMVVTHTYWDVYLPIGFRYQKVTSNMNTVAAGILVNPRVQTTTDTMKDKMIRPQVGNPLRMKVPQQGIQYSFEKLYANQSEAAAYFEISYASSMGGQIGLILSIISVILIWAGIFSLRSGQSQRVVLTTLITGILTLVISLTYLHTKITVPFNLALAGGLVFALILILPKVRQWRDRT
ncbi:MAG: hypothetical protein JKY19_15930 [Alcanivoracaceae bacterium]|nr:hypothetical protein [Alcanivoracaceae bacterium]